MHSRLLVLSLKIFARQIKRYAYSVALLCALCMILVALFFLRLVEKVFVEKDDEGAICN